MKGNGFEERSSNSDSIQFIAIKLASKESAT